VENTKFTEEIQGQPAALKRLTDYYGSTDGRALLDTVTDICTKAKRILFTGMGTSMHAPYCILKELGALPQCVEIRDAGELLHFGMDSIRSGDAVIAISQSGESAETKRVAGELQGKVPVISIVNDESSFMGNHADVTLPMLAGSESSISNKTYSNTLSILMMISTLLKNNSLDTCLNELRETAERMLDGLGKSAEDARSAAEFLNKPVKTENALYGKTLHTIARGSDLVTAYQLGLILKEGAGVFAEGMSAGLFRHGPLELAGEGHSAAFFLSKDNKPDVTMNLVKDTHSNGTRVLIVSDAPYFEGGDILNVVIETPYPRYFAILCAPFIELFVHEMALKSGLVAGVFRNVSKITSIE
jgi:glutamine---fructose-6-phosphate transaminase (isomerizing)